MDRYAPGEAAWLYQHQRGRQLEQAFHAGSAATKKKMRWKAFHEVLHKTVCHKTTWKTCFSKATWETNRKTVILCPVIDFFLVLLGFFGGFLVFWIFFMWVRESKASVSSFVHVLPILLNIRLQDTLLYRFSSDNFVQGVTCQDNMVPLVPASLWLFGVFSAMYPLERSCFGPVNRGWDVLAGVAWVWTRAPCWPGHLPHFCVCLCDPHPPFAFPAKPT